MFLRYIWELSFFVFKSPLKPPGVRRKFMVPSASWFAHLKKTFLPKTSLKRKDWWKKTIMLGPKCRCWKNVKFSSKWKLKIAQNFPWPSFFYKKSIPNPQGKTTPLPNLGKIFKGSLFRYSFRRDDTKKKLDQITTPTARRVTGGCGASDKTNQMTRPKQPFFLSDPFFVVFFLLWFRRCLPVCFRPTTMGRFSGK